MNTEAVIMFTLQARTLNMGSNLAKVIVCAKADKEFKPRDQDYTV